MLLNLLKLIQKLSFTNQTMYGTIYSRYEEFFSRNTLYCSTNVEG